MNGEVASSAQRSAISMSGHHPDSPEIFNPSGGEMQGDHLFQSRVGFSPREPRISFSSRELKPTRLVPYSNRQSPWGEMYAQVVAATRQSAGSPRSGERSYETVALHQRQRLRHQQEREHPQRATDLQFRRIPQLGGTVGCELQQRKVEAAVRVDV